MTIKQHKAGGRCPVCNSDDCDEMDTDYGEDKNGCEILSRRMICNFCDCKFTDEYKYIETRKEE